MNRRGVLQLFAVLPGLPFLDDAIPSGRRPARAAIRGTPFVLVMMKTRRCFSLEIPGSLAPCMGPLQFRMREEWGRKRVSAESARALAAWLRDQAALIGCEVRA